MFMYQAIFAWWRQSRKYKMMMVVVVVVFLLFFVVVVVVVVVGGGGGDGTKQNYLKNGKCEEKSVPEIYLKISYFFLLSENSYLHHSF